MTDRESDSDAAGREALAVAVRRACLEAAAAAAEDAGLAGLCADGRLDRALDAIRALDLTPIVHLAASDDDTG